MGTITTVCHAAIKAGQGYEGTMQDIVRQVCSFLVITGNTQDGFKVEYAVRGYVSEQKMYVRECWTYEEVYNDALRTIYKELPQYGYRLYRDIGF